MQHQCTAERKGPGERRDVLEGDQRGHGPDQPGPRQGQLLRNHQLHHPEVLTHSRDKDCQSPHAAQVLTRCLLPTHTHRHTQILTHDAHALELTHTYTHTCYATFLFTLKKKSACFVFVHFFYSIFYHFLVFFFLNRKKSVGK